MRFDRTIHEFPRSQTKPSFLPPLRKVRQRFVICGINYAPDLIGISKYTTEMAEWLAAQGHDVRVITAAPYYPDWKIPEGYTGWWYQREKINGVMVYRCPIHVPTIPSGSKRLLHLLSFALSSMPIMLWLALMFRPHIFLTIAPPLFTAPFTRFAAWICRGKSWLHVQDFEVDAAFELGLLKGNRLRRFALRGERALMKLFHHVSSISPQMVRLLREKGAAPAKTCELRNWVDLSSIYPVEGANLYRVNLQLGADDVLVLYSGNIAQKQGIEMLADVARQLVKNRHIHFLVVGDGPGKKKLLAATAGLSNMHFLPLQPHEYLNTLLSAADIHVLPQRANAADLVLPSKLTGMLASGRPVVATAASGTGVANEIAGRGIAVLPGDAEALTNAIEALAADPVRRKALGEAARSYAETHLGRDSVLAVFEERCGMLVQPLR